MRALTCIIPAALAVLALPASADPLRPGTVTVEVAPQGATPDIQRPLVEAVQGALANANFVVMPNAGHGRYIARVAVARDPRGSVTSQTIPGKPTGSVGGWGARGSVTLPSAKREMHDLTMTELTVTLLTRTDGRQVWQGRATTAQVDGTREGDPASVFAKLAAAVIARFPGSANDLISVP